MEEAPALGAIELGDTCNFPVPVSGKTPEVWYPKTGRIWGMKPNGVKTYAKDRNVTKIG